MRVQIVSFRCVLKNKLGHLISSSFNQDIVTTPTSDQVDELPALTESLKGLKPGERKTIKLSAQEAYGFYEPDLCITLPRKDLKRGKFLKLGDLVQGSSNPGENPRSYSVTACTPVSVTLDANHPLAGQDLVFNVEVIESREEIDPEPILYC